MTELTVSAGLVRSLIDYAQRRGANCGALLSGAGIDPEILVDRDNRVAMSSYRELIYGSQAETGDPAFALNYAAAVDLSEFSVVGLISQSSPTMLDALAQLNRFGQLVAEVETVAEPRFEIVKEGRSVWMVDHRALPNDFPELTEITFARLVCGARRVAHELNPVSVCFTHDKPQHAECYEEIFRAPVRFSAKRNGMQLNRHWLERELPHTPSYLFGILAQHAETHLEALAKPKGIRAEVEASIIPVLHRGGTTMHSVCEELGTSRHSLYRRLKAEGITFEQVLDELRQRLAKSYLRAGKASINETAYLLGFSEPSSFSRAFKRWTGRSPREFQVSKGD